MITTVIEGLFSKKTSSKNNSKSHSLYELSSIPPEKLTAENKGEIMTKGYELVLFPVLAAGSFIFPVIGIVGLNLYKSLPNHLKQSSLILNSKRAIYYSFIYWAVIILLFITILVFL